MYKLLLYLMIAVFGLALSVKAGDMEAAKEDWKKHCSKCHADDGTGDTRMGKRLEVPDYTDPEVLKDYSDEELFEIIKEGVEDTKMRGFESKLSDEAIQALVEYTRSFAEES